MWRSGARLGCRGREGLEVDEQQAEEDDGAAGGAAPTWPHSRAACATTGGESGETALNCALLISCVHAQA